jgi:hypothetical protein
VKDTENMVEQRTADVRTVGWSLRQKEILGIVLDAIHSLRPSALFCEQMLLFFNLNAVSIDRRLWIWFLFVDLSLVVACSPVVVLVVVVVCSMFFVCFSMDFSIVSHTCVSVPQPLKNMQHHNTTTKQNHTKSRFLFRF